MELETAQFKRAHGEFFHQCGRKVWLMKKGWRVTVNPRKGKPFGRVIEDSIHPQEFVKVEIWNAMEWADWNNRNLDPVMVMKAKLKRMKKKPLRRMPAIGPAAKNLKEALRWVKEKYG